MTDCARPEDGPFLVNTEAPRVATADAYLDILTYNRLRPAVYLLCPEQAAQVEEARRVLYKYVADLEHAGLIEFG